MRTEPLSTDSEEIEEKVNNQLRIIARQIEHLQAAEFIRGIHSLQGSRAYFWASKCHSVVEYTEFFKAQLPELYICLNEYGERCQALGMHNIRNRMRRIKGMSVRGRGGWAKKRGMRCTNGQEELEDEFSFPPIPRKMQRSNPVFCNLLTEIIRHKRKDMPGVSVQIVRDVLSKPCMQLLFMYPRLAETVSKRVTEEQGEEEVLSLSILDRFIEYADMEDLREFFRKPVHQISPRAVCR